MTIRGVRGVCPIGAVVGWLKSTTNMPTLANQGRDEWVELNGATINDIESPLNGQTLPDANGDSEDTKKFLRGADTSGGEGSCDCHYHCFCVYGYDACYHICVDTNLDGMYDCCGWGYCTYYVSCTDNAEHIPPYLEVVWIVRIK